MTELPYDRSSNAFIRTSLELESRRDALSCIAVRLYVHTYIHVPLNTLCGPRDFTCMLVCDPMGKITVFTVDDCPFCRKAKDLLALKNVKFDSISLTEKPEWRSLLFLLTNGRTKVPQIFFNEKLIGGSDALQKLEDEGKLDQLIRKALEERDPAFPPPLRKPSGEEFLQVRPRDILARPQSAVVAIVQ